MGSFHYQTILDEEDPGQSKEKEENVGKNASSSANEFQSDQLRTAESGSSHVIGGGRGGGLRAERVLSNTAACLSVF